MTTRDEIERLYFDDVDYPTAHVTLIDALRTYLATCAQIDLELEFAESALGCKRSDKDKRDDRIHMQQVRLLLKQMEDWSFTPTVEMKK